MQKAFSLIELLVVVSIIGILTTLVTANLNAVRGRARDTTRKSDIKQYSTSLESFANGTASLYPSFITPVSVTDSGGLCTKLGMTTCPSDPMLGADQSYQNYKYISDGSGNGIIDATSYSLWADMEGGTNDFWILCSNGKVGVSQTQPNQSNNCPL